MILTRAPLRIPLGGGGTDFPDYYLKHGGYILGFALDKYVHVVLHDTIDNKIRLKYSHTECVDHTDELENRVAAEALNTFGITGGIEIATFSDVPESSGLGGSSSFCVALVAALRAKLGKPIVKEEIFQEAYNIERIKARQPGGMQDQWFAAYGGVHCIDLDGANPQRNGIDLTEFLTTLRLLYTGTGRSDLSIAHDQVAKVQENDSQMLERLADIKGLGRDVESCIRKGDYSGVGSIFHTHWQSKKVRNGHISNDVIDNIYKGTLEAGAVGGKLLGLGGGGYLLLSVPENFEMEGLLPLGIDTEGVKVVYRNGS